MSEEIKSALKLADNCGIDECQYCKYDDDCKHGVTSDGYGNPVYPPCSCGDSEFWVDKDRLLECIEQYKKEAEEDGRT